MANAYTDIKSGVSLGKNLVQTAFDRYVDFALRSQPLFRTMVDKRPVDISYPSTSVVFNLYQDLAPTVTPLDEITDPDSVAIPATTNVTVNLNEYGRSVISTRKLRLASLSDIDPAIFNIVSYDMVNSLDKVLANVLVGGTNVARRVAGAVKINSGAIGDITATDTMTAEMIETTVTKLRTNNALPRMGDLYVAYVHPDCALDLRREATAGGWRDPHVYSAAGNIWSGFTGAFGGAAIIETPRVVTVPGASGKPQVYQNLMFAQEAACEAVGEEGSIKLGPYTDALMRLKKVDSCPLFR